MALKGGIACNQVLVVPLLRLLVELLDEELELNSAVKYVCVSLSAATAVSIPLYSVVSVAE
jgi:hypothetical protein